MITKVFRPFWSYDVQKTEEWLSSMAEHGYELINMNRWTRYYRFRQGKPKKRMYRIGFDKNQEALPNRLADNGWIKVLQSGNWFITANEKPPDQIKTFPVRESIIKRNKKIMYISTGTFSYLTIVALINAFIISVLSVQTGSVEIVDSPYWAITYSAIGIGIALWALTLYSIIKINTTNKKLIGETVRRMELQRKTKNEDEPTKDEVKQLKRSGRLIVKRRFAWWYAPDKLEEWLETMEEQGFHLYRVGQTGSLFYFSKGSPRKISYCADYQNIADEGYFNFHRDAGWKSIFRSSTSILKWTLWSREYSEGEERPQIYSDKTHQLKHARRIAITYSCMFIPLVIFYILMIGSNIDWMSRNNPDQTRIINTAIFVLIALQFGSFSVRTWMYYRRLSKRFKYNMR